MTDHAERHDLTLSERERDPVVAVERAELLILCGLMGMLGPLAFTVGLFVMQVIVPGHDPISETISDLGRGELSVAMDTFFYINAAGCLALALGSAHTHLGRWGWSIGIVALTLTALVITLLGVWDEFGATAEGDGLAVHTKLAMALLPLFAAGPALMSEGASRAHPTYRWLFLAAAVLWPVAALAYWFSPDTIDGLTERVAGAVTLLWTIPLGWFLYHRGRVKLHD